MEGLCKTKKGWDGNSMKKPYFPLFTDISDKKIVVVGGGKIATRRVDTLLEFADDISVAAPEASKRIRKLAKEGYIVWKECAYQAELLTGADLVLAATDDAACNEKIVEDCRARGILVNTAHKKELCDFYFPGILRQEELVIGFGSNGMSHKKVREIREKMERMLRE